MSRILKTGLAIATLTTIISCSAQPPAQNSVIKADNKAETVKQQIDENITTVDVGGGKASFVTVLNFNSSATGNKDFSTKVSTAGQAAKLVTDISKVDAYLIELTSPVAAGTDLFGASSVNVKASALNLSKTTTSTTFKIKFQNVPVNSGTKKYFVGVVAKDSSTAVISKPPATAWGGSTTPAALALSSSGVNVSGTGFVIDNGGIDLPITVNLLDATGAQVGAAATVNAGNSAVSGSPTGTISEP